MKPRTPIPRSLRYRRETERALARMLARLVTYADSTVDGLGDRLRTIVEAARAEVRP